MLGRASFVAGRYEGAIEVFQRNADRGGPMAAMNQAIWAAALGAIGRVEEASYRLQEMRRYDPQFTLARARTMHRYVDDDEQARMLDGLRKAGLPE